MRPFVHETGPVEEQRAARVNQAAGRSLDPPAAPCHDRQRMLIEEIEFRIAKGALRADPLQRAAALRLERLADELARLPQHRAARAGLMGRLLGAREAPPPAPRGVYLHGDVGRGKSMLMDLFFAAAPVPAKRRVHFHAFMLEVQARLHALRQTGGRQDPLQTVAGEIAGEVRLLCFDEFHVTDIADAMILGRLFEGLFERGVVVVATSNWPPRRLYEDGLNRDRFLPFIDLLLRSVDVVALEGPVDYRLQRLREAPVYHTPLGPESSARLGAIFRILTDGAERLPEQVAVGSRTLEVPKAAAGVAWLGFIELCGQALGAADYLALARQYHTLILDGVPVLWPGKRSEARRFMTLIDALYERRMMLFVAAEVPPEALYPSGEGAFEFQRTVSRLMEMQSRDWLEQCRERPAEAVPFVPFALTSDLI